MVEAIGFLNRTNFFCVAGIKYIMYNVQDWRYNNAVRLLYLRVGI